MLQITRKDLNLFFADRKALLLTFLLPIALITLFVFTFGGTSSREGMSPLTLLVSDLDKSPSSGKLTADIDSLPSVKVEKMEREEAIEEVKKGDELAVLVILPGYEKLIADGESGFELYIDNVRPTESEMLQGMLMSALFRSAGKSTIKSKVISKIKDDFAGTDSVDISVIENFIDDMMESGSGKTSAENPVESMVKRVPLQGSEEINPALVHSVAGTAVMMLLFAVAGMGSSLLEEKEKGTLKRLLYSPLNPMHILSGKLLSTILVSMMQLVVMFLFAALVFGLDITYNLPALLITLVATAFTCSCFGVFIASVSSSRKQVESLATIVVLLMSAIGGSMVPSFVMPEFMQKAGVISVNYWSIQSVYDIYLRDFSWEVFMIKTTVLFSIGCALLAIALPLFKRNLLKLT